MFLYLYSELRGKQTVDYVYGREVICNKGNS